MTPASDPPVLPVLISYAYGERWDLDAAAAEARAAGIRLQIMADSGAFTAHTTGRTISLDRYAEWLEAWYPLLAVAAPLDVIGDPVATTRNVELLRERLDRKVTVLGAFHCGSPPAELRRQCEGGRYVGLGGAVGLTGRREAMMRFLVWAHRVARDCGAVLHGFGITVPAFVTPLPWMSVDSSYWTSAARTGTLALFDHLTGTWRTVRMGSRKALAPTVAPLIRRYGGNPTRCAAPGFGQVGVRGDRGRAEREWLTTTAVRSWLRYGRWWRQHTPAVTGPGPAGPTLYLAVTDRRSLRHLIDTAAYIHRTGGHA